MNAFANSRGTLFALLRSAFQISKLNVGYYVMSSEAFVESDSAVLAAWETEEQIFYSWIDPRTGEAGVPTAATGSGPNRKYLVLAVNRNGYALLGWAEGMAWKKVAVRRGRYSIRRANQLMKSGARMASHSGFDRRLRGSGRKLSRHVLIVAAIIK